MWEAASYTARSVQRTAFITIETTAATSRLVTEKAEQAMEALFPKPAPVTEASLESILPPGSHLGNRMKDVIRQNTLPYQEGSGTLTDAARQIDFALLQTVLRLKLDKGRILLLTSDYRTQGKDIYHLQRMRIYLPPVVQDPAPQAPRNENGNAPSAETGDVKGPPEPVFRFLNALAEVNGETDYLEIINNINRLIDRQKAILATRKTINAKRATQKPEGGGKPGEERPGEL
jgi:hypothetical protein